MIKTVSILLLLLFFSANIFGQNNTNLDKLNDEFQLFNYTKVIRLADGFIANSKGFSEDELVEIYLLKGISHYSLSEPELVKNSFNKILDYNQNYQINTSKVSPKIIREFENLRNEHKRDSLSQKINSIVIRDTLYQVDTLILKPNNKLYSETVARSIIYPGWGHLYSGNKTKGWLLSSANTVVLGSMLYFIYDTNQKESSYLNEVDLNLVEQKYNDFNSAYKIRNALIATYAVLWIYTQIDILFFSEIPFVPVISSTSLNNTINSYPTDIQFIMQFQL